MATSDQRLLLGLSLLLGFLSIAATARPGRQFHPSQNLVLFSTSSYPIDRNPNFPSQNPTITFFFTPSRCFNHKPPLLPSQPQIIVDRANLDEGKRTLPFGLYSSVGASFRDRANDILSVVGSLLLGIACGAVTAATLYLIWYLFTPNRFDYRDYDDDVGPKKMGYVVIPAADSPVKAVDVAPAKEVV